MVVIKEGSMREVVVGCCSKMPGFTERDVGGSKMVAMTCGCGSCMTRDAETRVVR